MRTAGYSWLQDNKSNKNFAEIKVTSNIKMVLPNVTKIWAVPSSKSIDHDKSLKELAIVRMKSRFDISNEKHFDDFYFNCYEGMKARYCKHSVGLMYKTELLEISSEVRKEKERPTKEVTCLSYQKPSASDPDFYLSFSFSKCLPDPHIVTDRRFLHSTSVTSVNKISTRQSNRFQKSEKIKGIGGIFRSSCCQAKILNSESQES